MRSFDFVTVDVFTDRRFGGNPLAVFPDAAGLSDQEMQALAAEFNLSETTFVLPPDDPVNTARVRIFTPKAELPFAGHPNVGTGWVLARRGQAKAGVLLFEEAAGLVRVEIGPGGASIAAPQPLGIQQRDLAVALVAAGAGLLADDVRTDGHAPLVAGVGLDFTFLEVKDAAALARAAPDMAGCIAYGKAYPDLGHALGLLLYVRDGANPHHLATRMFAPTHGIPEDPATGSANAALAALLLHLSGAGNASYRIVQGVEMGRPSVLHATARRGPDGIHAVIGGTCVPVMRGTVDL